MNELSWLIYAADVAGSVKGLSGIMIGGSAITAAALAVVDLKKYKGNSHRSNPAAWDSAMADHVKYPSLYPKPKNDRPEDGDEVTWYPWKAAKSPIIAMFGAAFLFCAFPSSSTLYAIAASQLGEKVLASATAGKAVQALNSWLDQQISGPSK